MSTPSPEAIVCFRFLEDDEFHLLESIYKEERAEIPDPRFSKIAVAELNGEIIGFCPFELKPQIAMWVHPEHRGSRLWYKLASMIEPLTHRKSTCILATQPVVAEICEAAGMREVHCRVFIKDVNVMPVED